MANWWKWEHSIMSCLRMQKTDAPSICYKTDDEEENEITLTFDQYKDKPQWGNIVSLKVNNKDLVEELGSNSDVGGNSQVLGATSTIAGLAQLHNVYFVAADRRGPMDYAKKNDNQAENKIGIHGEFLINTLAQKGADFVKEVAKNVSLILDGASVKVKDTDTDYLRFYLDSVNGTEGFRPTNVGFGYSYILPIVITMLMAEPGAKIFMENPEAHLHPGAQSRLVDFLIKKAKEHSLQLFIETHSEHIINGLRIAVVQKELPREEARIIFFARENDFCPQVCQIKIDRQGNLSDYPNGFMDEWGIQMAKLV